MQRYGYHLLPFVNYLRLSNAIMVRHEKYLPHFQVRLIASVPGYHTGVNLKKWGHMKLRTVLQECTFDGEFKKSPLVYQVSNMCYLELLANVS